MRRIMSLILIPVVIASQWCVMAHAHGHKGIVEPAGHSARPHFHVHGVHDHHHAGAHSHSHSHGPEHSHENSEADDQSPALISGDTSNHDADAVYCSNPGTPGMSRQSRTDEPITTASAVTHFLTLGIWDSSGMIVVNRQNLPPPFLGQTCPLFLRNLSIRC